MQEFDMEEYDEADEHVWHSHEWTTQEAKFVEELLFHGDHSRAYMSAFSAEMDGSKAGWRTKCAILGSRLARKKPIAAYIRYVRDKIKARMELTPERVLAELSALAYGNMADFVVIQEDGSAVTDLSGLTREQAASLQEVTIDVYTEGRGESSVSVKSTKIKLAPKVGALELLGKHFKLFTDVVENTNVTDAEKEITAARSRSRKLREKLTSEDDTGEENATD